jgi:hypothetical protein
MHYFLITKDDDPFGSKGYVAGQEKIVSDGLVVFSGSPPGNYGDKSGEGEERKNGWHD